MSTRLNITLKLFYLNRKKLVFIFYLPLLFHHRTLLYNYIINKRKNYVVAGYSLTFNKHVSLALLNVIQVYLVHYYLRFASTLFTSKRVREIHNTYLFICFCLKLRKVP